MPARPESARRCRKRRPRHEPRRKARRFLLPARRPRARAQIVAKTARVRSPCESQRQSQRIAPKDRIAESVRTLDWLVDACSWWLVHAPFSIRERRRCGFCGAMDIMFLTDASPRHDKSKKRKAQQESCLPIAQIGIWRQTA